jgi:hypothetical protein
VIAVLPPALPERRPAEGPALRVATIPHDDPYVAAVLPSAAVQIGPADVPSPWLDPSYLAAAAAEVDVVHLHSGYGHLRRAAVEAWTEQLRRLDLPLVLTVHQLRDPSRPSRSRHDPQLADLLGTAEVVLTLTRGAADEIADRYGRTAIVVAHPSVAAPLPGLGAERGLVGVAVGPPSPALPEPEAVVRAALSGAVSGGGRLRVFVAPSLEVAAELPFLASLASAGQVEVVASPPAGTAWAARLQQLHVLVLPQRCGTHSRDVEVCRDVGTRVVAPSCGWFADQWSEVVGYGHDERSGLDAVSLTGAVAAALTRPMPRPTDRSWREEQRAAIQRVHAAVYAQVAADRRGA